MARKPRTFKGRKLRPTKANGEIAELRRLRGNLRVTQDTLAKISGFHVSEIREWESGRRQPRPFAVSVIKDSLAALNKGGDRD